MIIILVLLISILYNNDTRKGVFFEVIEEKLRIFKIVGNNGFLIIKWCCVSKRIFCFYLGSGTPPKYVLSLDEYDMSKDGITHLNIEEWLIHKVGVT